MTQEVVDAYSALGLQLLSLIVAAPGALAGFSVVVAAAATVAGQQCTSKFRWCCIGEAVASIVACSVVAPFSRGGPRHCDATGVVVVATVAIVCLWLSLAFHSCGF